MELFRRGTRYTSLSKHLWTQLHICIVKIFIPPSFEGSGAEEYFQMINLTEVGIWQNSHPKNKFKNLAIPGLISIYFRIFSSQFI